MWAGLKIFQLCYRYYVLKDIKCLYLQNFIIVQNCKSGLTQFGLENVWIKVKNKVENKAPLSSVQSLWQIESVRLNNKK